MWNWMDWAYTYTAGLVDSLWVWVTWLWGNILSLYNWVLNLFKEVFWWLSWVAGRLWRGINALLHLNFSRIWAAIKRGFERFQKILVWLRRRIFGPLDAYRKLILELYRRFWAPVIRFLDSLRVFTRILAIFNRRLAALLDQKLWAIESKLLSPITAALRRVNELSSYLGALITVSGYLDRVLLLESLRRDASMVWEVLTNPRAIFHERASPWMSSTTDGTYADLRQAVRTQSGPTADTALSMLDRWRSTMKGLT